MAGALDLGELYAKLAVDFSELEKAERHAQKFSKETIESFGRIDKAGKRLKKVGTYATGVSAALVGTGLASAKMANTFDKNIAEINSLLSESSRDFKGLKEDVRGVAVALGTDLNESAAAAYQAISAGVPRENLVDFLTVGTKAAIAGVTDTETAINGITTVMNAWGDSAGSAADVADVMFTAVKNGKTTFEELSRSMFQAAGIAPELGIDFKEVAAAVATMTKQGVPTSVAMTQLRQSMVALKKPNEEMADLLKAAGIESVDAEVAASGLAGTWAKLRATSDKTGISLEKSVGSVEGLNAVLKITGKNSKGFQKDMEAMGASSGAMTSAFEEIDKTRGFDKIVNQFKAIATIIGDALIPVLMPLAQGFANWLTKLTELDPGLVRIGVVIGGVVAALGPLLLGIGSFVSAAAPLIASAGGVKAALAALAAAGGPVTLVIAAIAAGAVLLWKNWKTVANFFRQVIGAIVSWFQEWYANNQETINGLVAAWQGFVDSAKNLWSALSGAVTRGATAVIEWLDNMLEPIGGLQGAWEIFGEAVGMILTGLVEGVKLLFEGVSWVFNSIADVLNGNKSLWDVIKEAWNASITAIGKVVETLWPIIKDIFAKIWEYLKTLPGKFLEIGKQIMQGLIDGISSMADGAIDTVKDVGQGIYDGITGFLGIESPSKLFKQVGKWTMEGLAIGITAGAPMATQAAEQAAADTLAAFEKKMGGNEFGGGFGGGGFGGGFGGGGGFGEEVVQIPGQPEIAQVQEYFNKRLEVLREAGHAETNLSRQIEMQRNNELLSIRRAQLAGYGEMFDGVLSLTKEFAGEQSGIYKAMFAISKGFAIAEASVAIYQNIANAMRVGFPQNIPFIAGAISQGASLVSTIKSISMPSAGAFYNGGSIPSGQVGTVGEKGMEIVGPANVFSTQKTKELFAGMGKGGSKVVVNLIGAPRGAEVTERQEGDTTIIDVKLQQFEEKLAGEATSGRGKIFPAFADAHNLTRQGR